MGRQRAMRYGLRVIDLDILFCGDEAVYEPRLEKPALKSWIDTPGLQLFDTGLFSGISSGS